MKFIFTNYFKTSRILPIITFMVCFNFSSFAIPLSGSWLGAGNVNLSIVTTDANNTDGVGDGAIYIDGQSAVVGQGVFFQFSTPMTSGENLSLSTYTYNQDASYVKFKVQLYNATNNTILVESAEVNIANASAAPVNTVLSYTTLASDVGDYLQIRYIRTDDGNTSRNFAIDNVKLNGSFLSLNFSPSMAVDGILSGVRSTDLSLINSDADNGDGVGDGAVKGDAQLAGLPEGIVFKFNQTMTTNQVLNFRTFTFNPEVSFVRYNVQLFNLTDGTVLATKEVFHVGGDATAVKTEFAYSAKSTDNGDSLQLRYLRVDDGNKARGFAIDNASINGVYLPQFGGGGCPITVTPDLPLLPSTPAIDTEIAIILRKYSDDLLGTSAPSINNLNTAIAQYNALHIMVTGNTITGDIIPKWNVLKFLQVLASELKFNPGNTAVEAMARNTVWLASKQFCDGDLAMDQNAYEYREFGRGAIFLKSILTPGQKQLFENTFYIREKKYIDFWLANYNQAFINANNAIVTDWMYNLSDILMGYAGWQKTADERYRYMVAIKRYMERFLTTSPGTSDGIKVDGTGFHHNAAYNNYMYAYNTVVDVTYYLDGSRFQINQNSYKVLRDAVMAQHVMANDARVQPLSTCGRNPQNRQNESDKSTLKRLSIVGGHILGLATADPSTAGPFNRIYGTDPELNYTTVAPIAEGFTQFNHMYGGSYKKDNWLAYSRGFSDNMWGSESYLNQNRYGRYQSYGTMEVIYPGDKVANGYDVNTWDWNYNPGATVIRLPWAKLHAERERLDEIQQKRFAGTLTLGNKNNIWLKNTYGTYGMFAMDFQQKTGQGFGATYSSENHNSSFAFKKSNFFFDDMIICLGSNISNNNNTDTTITTLFQRLDNNANDVIVNNNAVNASGNTTFSGAGNNWILSNYKTGFYVFADNNNSIMIKNSVQQTPNQNQTWPVNISSNPTAAYNVGYINHGKAPSNKGYEYIVKPSTNTASMQALDVAITSGNKPYIVRRKNSTSHIVQYLSKDIWGYAIFGVETALPWGRIKSINTSSLVMTKYDSINHSMLLSVDNPDVGFILESYAPSVSKNVNVTVYGEWHLQSTYPNVQLISSNATETVLKFYTINGLPDEITLVEGPVSCPTSQVGTACNDGNPCTINDKYDGNCNCVGTVTTFTDTIYANTCIQSEAGTVVSNTTNGNGCALVETTITTYVGQADIFVTVQTCNQAETGIDTVLLTNSLGCQYKKITTTTYVGQADVFATAQTCIASQAGKDTVILTNGSGCQYKKITTTTYVGQADVLVSAQTCIASQAGKDTVILTNGSGCQYKKITTTTYVGQADVFATTQTCIASQAGKDTVILTNGAGCQYKKITTTTYVGQADVFATAQTCIASQAGKDTVILTNGSGCQYKKITTTTYVGQADVFATAQTCIASQAGKDTVILTNGSGCQYKKITTTTYVGQADVFTTAQTCIASQAGKDTVVLTNGSGCQYKKITTTTYVGQADVFATAQTCIASQAGRDTVVLTNGSGCQYKKITTTTYVGQADVFATAQTCIASQAGKDTVVLTNGAGCQYKKITTTTYVGQADVFVNAETCVQAQAGKDTVILTNGSGCQYRKITTTSFVGQLSDVFVTVETCIQAQAGKDTVVLTNGSGCQYKKITTTTYVGQADVFATAQTCIASQAGKDTVILTNGSGCQYKKITTTTLQPIPNVEFTPIVNPISITATPIDLSSFTTPTGGVFIGNGIVGSVFNPSTAGIGTHEIIYTVSNTFGCTNSDTIFIVVDLQTGINQFSVKTQFSVFPNPARDNIQIKLELESKSKIQLKIIDVLGQVMIEDTYFPQSLTFNKTIDLSKLAIGTYTLLINNEHNSFSKKIIHIRD